MMDPKDDDGLNISQPASFWLQPLKIEPKIFFLGLGLAAVKGAQFKLDATLEHLGQAFMAAGLKDQAGAAGWLLIYRSLLRALTELVTDSLDLLDSEKLPDEVKLEELAWKLKVNLESCNVIITSHFF